MRCSEEAHILALDVRNSRIGYALFAGPKQLLDWGTNTVPSQCKNRTQWIKRRMEQLLRHGSPVSIVMKQPRRAKLSGNASGVPILKAIRSVVEEHGIPMHVLERAEIEATFRPFRARTKEEIACAIVRIFPELLARLPPKRKEWQPEARAMIVFDAIATGIAYLQRCFPADEPQASPPVPHPLA
jgi:hypothetical protein